MTTVKNYCVDRVKVTVTVDENGDVTVTIEPIKSASPLSLVKGVAR
jgi:hypothetical protein